MRAQGFRELGGIGIQGGFDFGVPGCELSPLQLVTEAGLVGRTTKRTTATGTKTTRVEQCIVARGIACSASHLIWQEK